MANYTQSISSGVINLLSELGHVNAVVSFDSGCIHSQLETLIALVQGMDSMLAAVEQGLQRLQNDNVPMEIEPAAFALMPAMKFMPKLTAEWVFRPFYEPGSKCQRA